MESLKILLLTNMKLIWQIKHLKKLRYHNSKMKRHKTFTSSLKNYINDDEILNILIGLNLIFLEIFIFP